MAMTSDAESPRYLQGMLRGLNLPEYMRPTRAVIRESLPRTKDGKADRGALIATDIPESQILQVVQ
jgi:acyl-CoA synthetase (AMP-forming)/AMP-acid ligase II